MALQELQIFALWGGKQTAKGTAQTAPARRFKYLGGGGLKAPRADGSQAFSDLTQFTDKLDWVDTLVGSGAPPTHATPEELAWLLWAFQGGETTSAVTGPPAKTKHTTVPLPGLGHWLTFVQRVGAGAGVLDRQRHADIQIGQVVIEGSTANKDVRITPTLMSLDPGEQIAADPAAALPAKGAFLYTDGTSRFTIDGTTFRGHSQFAITMNKDLQPVYGDDVLVYDLAIGTPLMSIGVTLFFDADGRAQFNKLVYGTATPAAGTKPQKVVGALGSYGFDLRARDSAGAVNGDKFVLASTPIKWAIPDAPDPNTAGGAGTIALAGEVRKSGGAPGITVDVDCDSAAFTV